MAGLPPLVGCVAGQRRLGHPRSPVPSSISRVGAGRHGQPGAKTTKRFCFVPYPLGGAHTRSWSDMSQNHFLLLAVSNYIAMKGEPTKWIQGKLCDMATFRIILLHILSSLLSLGFWLFSGPGSDLTASAQVFICAGRVCYRDSRKEGPLIH